MKFHMFDFLQAAAISYVFNQIFSSVDNC
jgi:hypothetical protein